MYYPLQNNHEMVDYKPNMKGNVKKRSGVADNANTTDHSLGNSDSATIDDKSHMVEPSDSIAPDMRTYYKDNE